VSEKPITITIVFYAAITIWRPFFIFSFGATSGNLVGIR
jgi:hypothetical protein